MKKTTTVAVASKRNFAGKLTIGLDLVDALAVGEPVVG